MATIIRIKSCDGKVFTTDEKTAKLSGTIRNMLDDCAMTETEEADTLPNITAPILKKYLEWAKHHKDDALTEEDVNKEKRTDDILPRDADFMKVDQGTLFELILAANYLDAKGLLELTSKTVANMIKGKSPDEMRKTFNIKNDFSTEEEEEIRKENALCEEKQK